MDEPPPEELIAFAGRIFEHARRGETAALTAFLDGGLSTNLANQSGDTRLMLAAYHGRAETVTALLASGADPDRVNDRGQSPLAGAVFKGEDAVVAALLAAGADPDAGAPSARATAEVFGRSELLPAPGGSGGSGG